MISKGYSVEVDASKNSLNKKIRRAQIENFNFIGVIGNE